MFKSFFPTPRLFFPLLLVWITFSITIWYLFKGDLGAVLTLSTTQQAPVIGIGHFFTDSFLLLYLFGAGMEPAAPFRVCGPDARSTSLSCERVDPVCE